MRLTPVGSTPGYFLYMGATVMTLRSCGRRGEEPGVRGGKGCVGYVDDASDRGGRKVKVMVDGRGLSAGSYFVNAPFVAEASRRSYAGVRESML